MTERENLILAIGILEGVQASIPKLKLNAPMTMLWDGMEALSKAHPSAEGE